MYFLRQRVKDSLRALVSRNFIQSVPFEEIVTRFGPNEIRRFMQIGSNDGIQNDPIRPFIMKYGWSGLLIEPHLGNFRKLQATYQGQPNLRFENAGVGDRSSSLPMYYLTDVKDDEPGWYDQVCSFDKSTFLKNISVVPELIDRYSTIQVPVYTFEELMRKQDFDNIDLLHIDAEGWDYRILTSIDFRKYQPKLIMFESEWLTAYDMRNLVNLFRSNGYSLFRNGFDHVALKTKR